MVAGVDKNTVLRLLKGLPVRITSFNRICAALDTTMARQLLELAQPQERYRVSRARDRKWLKTRARTTAADLNRNLEVEIERWKLGWINGEPAFNGLVDCELFGGSIVSSVVEVFGPTEAQSHPSEAMVFCLRGKVRVTVGNRVTDLSEGDAIGFWASTKHSFAPAARLAVGQPPPLVLSIRVESLAPRRHAYPRCRQAPPVGERQIVP